MYSYETRVGYSTTDSDLKMTVPAILSCFQDVAIFEAENGKISLDYLSRHHIAWLLGAWQVVVLRRPRINEQVTVATAPYDFKGFLGYRNSTMTAADGEMLIKAASIWTLIDTDARHPSRLTGEMINGYEFAEKLEMNYAPRKISLIGEGREEEAFRIRRCQIDSNGHVNNVEYVKLAMELLPESGGKCAEIKELRVEYKRAAHDDDLVIPVVYTHENKMQVELDNTDHEAYAVVEFTL